jgi:tryptophan 2,3-dioxygenase
MKRVLAIQQVMIQQLDVLETMTPQDFNTFRDLLNPASGFQSSQFREVEYACGLKDERYMRFHEHDPVNLSKLQKRMAEPTLYEVLISLLKRSGYDVDEGTPEKDSTSSKKLQDALKKIYQEHESNYDLYLLCEFLIQFDELFQIWRFRHVKMVERTIGSKRGTGGSSGANYLRSTVDKSFFPELWDVRSEL